MAIPIKKFGQYVLLQVFDIANNIVFQTDDLKIDFDIRHINGWSRAKFTLTNLNTDTIKLLSSKDDYFVTIQTSLHDSALEIIANKMYISNVLEEIKVPESVFSMFCYSKLRRDVLEKPIDVKIAQPTVTKIIEACVKDTDFEGRMEFKHFPPSVLDYKFYLPSTRRRGTLVSVLEVLGREYRFNFYTDNGNLIFMYKPDAKNVRDTDFYSSVGDIQLSTTNMRSNPKIGPATLSVVSNLDPKIKPSTILDISKLLTIGTDASEETLFVAENYLKEKIAGFSKYQTLSVQHKGSNWTADWITQAAATSPTPGLAMNTGNWWS